MIKYKEKNISVFLAGYRSSDQPFISIIILPYFGCQSTANQIDQFQHYFLLYPLLKIQ